MCLIHFDAFRLCVAFGRIEQSAQVRDLPFELDLPVRERVAVSAGAGEPQVGRRKEER